MFKYEIKLQGEYKSLIDFTHDLEACNKDYSVCTAHKEELKSFPELSSKMKIEGIKQKIVCGDFRIVVITKKLVNEYKLVIMLAKFDSEGAFKGGSFESLIIKERKKTDLERFNELFEF